MIAHKCNLLLVMWRMLCVFTRALYVWVHWTRMSTESTPSATRYKGSQLSNSLEQTRMHQLITEVRVVCTIHVRLGGWEGGGGKREKNNTCHCVWMHVFQCQMWMSLCVRYLCGLIPIHVPAQSGNETTCIYYLQICTTWSKRNVVHVVIEVINVSGIGSELQKTNMVEVHTSVPVKKNPERKEQLWDEVGGWSCGMQWLVFCHCLQVAAQQTQLSVRPSTSLGPLPLSDWVARAVGWVSSECWTTVTSAALLGSWPSLFLVVSLILSCNKGWVRV